ncbi:MAG TPA: FAD-dependent oxidoreductase [Streptosporangiaceae bacterium]|jgi:thioredoxin reductase (NADPH)
MRRPVFLLVSGDERRLEALSRDLNRRYAADYQVVVAASATAGLATLADLAGSGAEVALVIADQHLAQLPAVDFLARAHNQHPGAKRVLLIDRGNWSSAQPTAVAMVVGKIDYHLYIPWEPLEQILYPAVSDFLAAWAKSRKPSYAAFRIVGSASSPASHRIRDDLTRIAVPYWFYEQDSPEGRRLLRDHQLAGTDVPVVLSAGGTVLLDPSHAELMAMLGFQPEVGVRSCDVAIVGGGPAGLAAAVYAASEGLHTLVLEPDMPGGQAGTSSLIRNYLGFPHGLSGDDLTNRAIEQAWLFGAGFTLARAEGLTTHDAKRMVHVAGGNQVEARAVVIATGVTWRRLGVPALEALVGAGVFYGAAGAESRAMAGRDAYVIGAGNSAGQAAIHLARHAASVTMVVRGPGLRATMSSYLVTQISKTPNIAVRPDTDVVDGHGSCSLEAVTLRHRSSGATEVVPAAGLFVMIGAEPRTGWLAGCLERDGEGFILTGRDLSRTGRHPAGWPLERPPLLLETSVPGVFAAGDVRHRSIKRVASAVGEGAIAIQLVHEYLQAERD